jgi:FRG domain
LKALLPKSKSTTIGNSPWEWIPRTFDDFLAELQFIATHCTERDHLVLYRGHRDREWLLDSTFARSCKKNVFGIEPWQKIRFDEFRMSTNYQQILLNLFFFKFDLVARPSDELFDLEEKHGIDPWFEFMKRLQQYPEEDTTHIKGTSIVDWTQNSDVAIYFANESRDGEGALWICDATATGKTLQVITVAEILKKMERLGSENASLGVPLIFHPKKQLTQKRAANQQPVYVAQMDLRVDLSEVWDHLQGQERSESIFVKLVLPDGTYEPCSQYLITKGITREFLFPE